MYHQEKFTLPYQLSSIFQNPSMNFFHLRQDRTNSPSALYPSYTNTFLAVALHFAFLCSPLFVSARILFFDYTCDRFPAKYDKITLFIIKLKFCQNCFGTGNCARRSYARRLIEKSQRRRFKLASSKLQSFCTPCQLLC